MKKVIEKLVKIFLILVLFFFSINGIIYFYRINTENHKFIENKNESYIEVDGYKIWYKIIGDIEKAKEISVLFHGFNVAGSMEWTRIESELDNNHAYIMFDYIGMGKSQRLANYDKPTEQWRIENIKEFVDLVVGKNKKYNLIGASYGGTIALLFSKAYPNQVKRVIIISPLFFTNQDVFSNIGKLPFEIGNGFVFLAMGGGFVGDLLYASNCGHSQKFCPTQMESDKRHEYSQLEGTTQSFVLYNEYSSEIDYKSLVSYQRDKIYILYGEEDIYIDEEKSDLLLEWGISKDNIFVIKDSDHVPHLSDPKQIDECLESVFA